MKVRTHISILLLASITGAFGLAAIIGISKRGNEVAAQSSGRSSQLFQRVQSYAATASDWLAAIDSQMYFSLSRYIDEPFLSGKSMGYAKIIAPDGRIIASTGHQSGLAVTTFDPKWRMPFWNDPSLSMRDLYDDVRTPAFYRRLLEP